MTRTLFVNESEAQARQRAAHVHPPHHPDAPQARTTARIEFPETLPISLSP